MPNELIASDDRNTVRAVVRWSRTGGIYGALLGGIVAIARVVSEAPPQPYHVSTIVLVGVYVFGGAVGGAIFGVCEHLMHSLVGAAIVGLLVFLPIAVATAMTHFPHESLSNIIASTFLGSLILGPPNFVFYVVMRRLFVGWSGAHPRNRGARKRDDRTN